MKRSKFIVILFTVAVCAVAIALLTGCDRSNPPPEYDYIVKFNYNVDNLDVDNDCQTQFLAVADGSPIIEPASPIPNDNNESQGQNKFVGYVVPGYYIEGWYTAVLDAEGNPTKDADGNIVLKDKWNFKTGVVHQDLTLFANFRKMPTFTIIVDGGDDVVTTAEPGKVYAAADIETPKRNGYTFMGYYTDETFTTKFTFPYTFTDENSVCYAWMLEGNWATVTTGDNFRKALLANRNMYFDVPSGSIDFTNVDCSDYIGNDYNGIIYGNGCTLKNMSIDLNYTRGTTSYSLFGNLGSEAEIKDLKFENVSFKIKVNSTATDQLKVSFFATDIDSNAKIENVTFADCSLTYEGESKFEIDTYGYYVSGGEKIDCFDETQLTVKNMIIKLDN